MNLGQIARVAAFECERQQVGLDRLVMLLKGYEIAVEESRLNGLPSYHMVMAIAKIVEPRSEGKTRITPVTFAGGGDSCPPASVKDASLRLFKNMPGDTIEEIDSWVEHFLWIHPFVDGNGRMAWILYNWLRKSLHSPFALPDYFG